MNKKDWLTVAALVITLASAVFGGMAWVEGNYVSKDTLQAYMEQVLERLQSIEEALR